MVYICVVDCIEDCCGLEVCADCLFRYSRKYTISR